VIHFVVYKYYTLVKIEKQTSDFHGFAAMFVDDVAVVTE